VTERSASGRTPAMYEFHAWLGLADSPADFNLEMIEQALED
jgi:hypothetical protein